MRALALAAVLLVALPAAAAPPGPADRDRALEILKTSISYQTTASAGQEPMLAYAGWIRNVLVEAGYRPEDIAVEPVAGTAILIARLPGRDPARKPLVISGHIDVVEARAEDWTRDPFTPVVENGYVFGRGATDNKFDISMVVTTLARLRAQNWRPNRDVILALSGDEETQMRSSAILAQRLKHADLVLNSDAGGGDLDPAGKALSYGIQGAEKTYADFTLRATDPGGHSSRPTPGNPIYSLARALERLEAYRFPVQSNEITRASLAASGRKMEGPVGEALRRFAADPSDAEAAERLSSSTTWAPYLRTTCVATMVSGGHATNALPQRAEANVNCRIFPGVSSEAVRKTLVEVLAEPSLSVTRNDDGSIDSPPSPLRPDVVKAVTRAVHAVHPGLEIVPAQSSGATDSMHYRAAGVPSYGVSGLFAKAGETYAHGLNERAPLAAIPGALTHWDSLIRDLGR
ncbi:MAG: M20/M25/M40 family metallo-hydrolase [Phenylobacterium sp.]|uniref:M20/M25/M40 family metallo-hydrolase n=1 Tax=Phenylobacterium sp. TaxID=1871053 RepID=UPI0025D1FAEC|nr:M20/M25/M40 family metallo-hydrolase [Phenylobacterium sp.]MCA6252301.1 M20/M25/M40 family metallo-hydrolase [Phenylobacterium sp.]